MNDPLGPTCLCLPNSGIYKQVTMPGRHLSMSVCLFVYLFIFTKYLCSSFYSRMPDPDFTVRDVKLLVGKCQRWGRRREGEVCTTCSVRLTVALEKNVLSGRGGSRCKLQPPGLTLENRLDCKVLRSWLRGSLPARFYEVTWTRSLSWVSAMQSQISPLRLFVGLLGKHWVLHDP